MLEVTARILGVVVEDLRVAHAIPTGSRSEVQLIRTRSDEVFVAKRYLDPDAALRFHAEASALRSLKEAGERRAPVPVMRGADPDALVIVMDAVDGPRVEDVIRGTDATRAVNALEAYARAIGTLHRAGRAAKDGMRALRDRSGYRDRDFWPAFARDQTQAAERLASASDAPANMLEAEIASVVARTFESEQTTVIHWDTWPGNAIVARDGAVLVDLENAMFGTPGMDVASWHLGFPAAPLRLPFANMLPPAVIGRMEQAYSVVAGLALDAEEFAFSVANRMLFEITWPSVARLAQRRLDQHVQALEAMRLDHAADLLDNVGTLPALASAMKSLASRAAPSPAVRIDPYAALAEIR